MLGTVRIPGAVVALGAALLFATTSHQAFAREELSVATEIEGQRVYDKACGTCHNSGVGGAPRFGVPGDWEKRIDKGLSTLIDHAINGYQGQAGMMPPKGGFADLSDQEVEAAVRFMVAKSS